MIFLTIAILMILLGLGCLYRAYRQAPPGINPEVQALVAALKNTTVAQDKLLALHIAEHGWGQELFTDMRILQLSRVMPMGSFILACKQYAYTVSTEDITELAL